MTTTLNDLMAELSEEDIKDVRKRARAHIKAMEEASRLDELRRALDKNQGEIAKAMGIGQNAVSQMEKRSDIQLSTLSRYVESLGFRLELAVVAGSGERVALKNFKPWAEGQAKVRKTAVKVAPAAKTVPSAAGKASKRNSGASKKAHATAGLATR